MPGRWKPSGVGRRAGAPSGNIAIALDDFTAGDSLSQPVSPNERSREPDVAEVSKKCRRPGLECADAQTIQFLLGPCRNAVSSGQRRRLKIGCVGLADSEMKLFAPGEHAQPKHLY